MTTQEPIAPVMSKSQPFIIYGCNYRVKDNPHNYDVVGTCDREAEVMAPTFSHLDATMCVSGISIQLGVLRILQSLSTTRK